MMSRIVLVSGTGDAMWNFALDYGMSLPEATQGGMMNFSLAVILTVAVASAAFDRDAAVGGEHPAQIPLLAGP